MSSHSLRPASVLCLALALSACGGTEGLPLLGGSVAGSYQGTSFTVAFGLAYERSATGKLIILGDEDLNCDSPLDDDPPGGHFASLSLPSLEVGDYGTVLVQMMRNVDGFEGRGSNSGQVTVTMSSAETVTGSVAYQYTDDEAQTYSLSGDFKVSRCPFIEME